MNLKNTMAFLLMFFFILSCKSLADSKIEQLKEVKLVSKNKSKTGIFDFTFKSNVDGAKDTFSIYLPQNYDKSKKYKLIVGLHGYSVYNKQVMVTEPIKNYADQNDAIILGPNGRGNYFYFGKAEADIISLINWTIKNYSVDENKIFLFGISMGGLGSLDTGLHYPDIFAGVVCIHGATGNKEPYTLTEDDNNFFNRVFSQKAFDASPEILGKNMFSIWFYENGLNLPILFIHSKDDPLVPYNETYDMYSIMKEKNYNVDFVSYDKLGHESAKIIRQSQTQIADFLNKYQRNSNPDTVYYKTTNNYYNKAYWVTLKLKNNNEEGFINIAKSIQNDKIAMAILEAKNLSGITIDSLIINSKNISVENKTDIDIEISFGKNKDVVKSKSSKDFTN
ncbi:MAG: hypothetical protein A2Y34_17385 [Spirochaetes bacterium GWC1_27_15]|nr:MAG: hypothetical protein A2Z98_15075 [Spirochaetes bacterium GWB1_27_13]OHD20663.1 MAG: hypothetical protein A2Y34_17385 [Spirochaetes bacterium GWC1_27_15]